MLMHHSDADDDNDHLGFDVSAEKNYFERDIGLDFLAQLSGDELQEILKEAGISNAVHR